jgi:hypothetical protein
MVMIYPLLLQPIFAGINQREINVKLNLQKLEVLQVPTAPDLTLSPMDLAPNLIPLNQPSLRSHMTRIAPGSPPMRVAKPMPAVMWMPRHATRAVVHTRKARKNGNFPPWRWPCLVKKCEPVCAPMVVI